jgi:hypothetical protein
MSYYKDDHIEIKESRLSQFDDGLYFAAAIKLLIKSGLEYGYQQRTILYKSLIWSVNHSLVNQTIILTCPKLSLLPYVLAMHSATTEKREFLTTFDCSQVLTKDAVATFVKSLEPPHRVTKDEIFEALNTHEHPVLIITDSKDDHLNNILITGMKDLHAESCLYIYNYSRLKKSLHLFAREHGAWIIEEADGSGLVIPER